MGWFNSIVSIVKIANTATGFYLNNFADDGQGISTNTPNQAVTTIGDLSFIYGAICRLRLLFGKLLPNIV
ncbi:hypothetical protein IQ247_04620 [Plectonema cf. radiosum LEGE 06105]|uniref:Uncharacterized protein n=1 Tax=Plectonema cf. radiosum LEGE 06105 TaxID=945769 RepID=A0A8J7JYZ6_9CYAN|nr:hypothetical protein [Plectonema radiosum]MBE9212002.1 hypothetical protein [Plectonema cf. radiosum LEGE 06105]